MEQIALRSPKKLLLFYLDKIPAFQQFHRNYQTYNETKLLKQVSKRLGTDKVKDKTVLFYPGLPKNRSALGKIFKVLNYTITNNPNDKFDFAVHWDDQTYKHGDPVLENLKNSTFLLNSDCTDISKEKVEQVFEECYGYSTAVDPLTFRGKCVLKSNLNAFHDGTIIECPIKEKEPDKFYQRVINNYSKPDEVEDIRIPVIGGKIPYILYKHRPANLRFASYNTRARIAKTEDVFTKDEVDKIIDFTKRMNLDYGELDMLHDRNDNRYYIIDVNNTPGGAPACLTDAQRAELYYMMSKAFKEAFIDKVPTINTLSL